MKIVLQDDRRYVLRFDKGEEVFEGLLKFAQQQNIKAAAFSGIGACQEIEVGDFEVVEKVYRKKTISENLEIVSLTGNVSVFNNQPALHMHGVFSRHDLSTIGGHVFKIVVSITCEIFLTKLDGEMKRELNEDLKLNLLT